MRSRMLIIAMGVEFTLCGDRAFAAREPATGSRRVVDADRPGAPIAELEAALQHYAYAVRALPADSVAACYAPTGQLLLPGLPPVVGPGAIHDFLAPMLASVAVDTTTMTSDLVAGTSTVASQWGSYRQVAGPKDGAHDLHVGRYSALWGYFASEHRWLLVRLMMQPMPTPAAPAPDSSSAPPPAR